MSVNKKIPQRQCIGCQQMKNKKDMIRIIKTSENEILLDVTGKKNGRGAYLCFDPACLEKAVKNKGLERSFKMTVSPEIYSGLRKEFEELDSK